MNKSRKLSVAAAGLAILLTGPIMAAENHTAGEILDDTLITTKVKAALVADPITKAHQISVETYKGSVKLSGFVDSQQAELRAVELARGVEGAMKIEDALDVRK